MSLRTQTLIIAGSVLAASSAVAQVYPLAAPGQSVFDSPREEFTSKGIPLGGVLVQPSLSVKQYYDSNIFATETNEKSDTITKIQPGIRVNMTRDTYALDAIAEATFSNYTVHDRQNAGEWNLGLGGHVDLTEFDTVRASFRHQRQTIARDDTEDGGGSGDPRNVHRMIGNARYEHAQGPYDIWADGRVQKSNFLDSSQDDADRTEYRGRSRFGYQYTPTLKPFLEASYDARDYDTAVDDSNVNRDAQRVTGLIGTEWRVGDRVAVDAAVGLGHWLFDERTFDDETVWVAEVGAGYNVSPQTTLKASVNRDQVHTTRAGSKTKTVLGGSLGVEHEFQRDLLVYGDTRYRNADFDGGDREDHDLALAIGGRYYIDANFSLSAEYVFSYRDSNAAGEDYERSQVWLGVMASF